MKVICTLPLSHPYRVTSLNWTILMQYSTGNGQNHLPVYFMPLSLFKEKNKIRHSYLADKPAIPQSEILKHQVLLADKPAVPQSEISKTSSTPKKHHPTLPADKPAILQSEIFKLRPSQQTSLPSPIRDFKKQVAEDSPIVNFYLNASPNNSHS